MSVRVEEVEGGVVLWVKVVPGAKRDGVAGELGERLKVRVSAAAEGGKANRAVCRVVAGALGVREKDVEIVSGVTNPEKCVRVVGLGVDVVRERLGV